jgi:NAD(P)H-nitrite reductase large subunit
MPERIVILGNSAAAIAAVRAIQARDADASITMVSAENTTAYSPVSTTHFLSGEIPESALYFCDLAFYRDRGITRHFGAAAVGLDTATQLVTLADGTKLGYDKLLIATGAAAKRVGGLDPEIAAQVHYLRTVQDARRIHEAVARASHVVMLGAGLVSLQVAAAVARPELKVTCVVSSRQVLSQNIDAVTAELLREHLESAANIEFLFGTNVTGIEQTGAGYRVHLDSGAPLAADLLVAGKGVAPNVAFIDRSQIVVDRGVVTDDHLRAQGHENVWAAGDVAESRNRITGEIDLVANWIDACIQGETAGANIAGGDITSPGSLSENITTLLGVSVASFGITRVRPGDGLREVVHRDERHGVYRRLILRGDVLVGATLLRDVDDAGVLRGAIAAGRAPWPSPEAAARGSLRYAAFFKSCLRGA